MRFPPEPVRERCRAKWWQWYYRNVAIKRKPVCDLRPFIVAGPPRSGTSLLCTLLNSKPNVVISNEPKQITGKRFELAEPKILLRGFLTETARHAVLRGRIMNKVDPSNPDKLTADTFNTGSARRAVQVDIDHTKPLCVGVKAPMPLLDNTDDFCNDWPDLKVIMIARDPVRTINSWRHSFGWQKGLEDPSQGARLKIYKRVPMDGAELERRAHLWRITIEECLDQAARRPSRAIFIQYEDLLDDPVNVIARVARHIGCPEPEAEIDVSFVRPQSRPNYKNLDDHEIELIRRICGDALPTRTESTAKPVAV